MRTYLYNINIAHQPQMSFFGVVFSHVQTAGGSTMLMLQALLPMMLARSGLEGIGLEIRNLQRWEDRFGDPCSGSIDMHRHA